MSNFNKESILLTAIISGKDHNYYMIEKDVLIKIADASYEILKKDIEEKEEDINLEDIEWEY